MKLQQYLKELGITDDKIEIINTEYIDKIIATRTSALTEQIKELESSNEEKDTKLSEYTKKERETLIDNLSKETGTENILKFANISDDDDEKSIKEKLLNTKSELEKTFTKKEEIIDENDDIETNKKTSKDEVIIDKDVEDL